jgi:Chromosome segregation ATPases
MEITLEAIISLIGLFVGGGGGAFFTWRYMRRKAKAEAITAEVDAAKDMQDLYQQMLNDTKEEREDRKQQICELRAERDHYKHDRNELRERVEKLQESIFEWKDMAENDRAEMKQKIARLGRKVDAMAPFMCGNLACKLRQRVTISEDGEIKTKRPSKKNDIEPNNEEL